MIKNIVFDFGGVIIGLDKDRSVAAFRRLGADAVAQYIDDYRSEDLFSDLELGRITTTEFCEEVRRKSHPDIDDDSICGAWMLLLVGIKEQKLKKIAQLRKHYRTLLLSNTNALHWEHSVREYFKDTRLYFEKCYLSYQLGIAKPSQEIFSHMLNDSHITPAETLFIDDSQTNCHAAEALGIHTWHVSTNEDWTETIDKLEILCPCQ